MTNLLYIYGIYLSIYLSIDLSVYLSIYLSILYIIYIYMYIIYYIYCIYYIYGTHNKKINIIISFNVLTIAFFKKLPCHISHLKFLFTFYTQLLTISCWIKNEQKRKNFEEQEAQIVLKSQQTTYHLAHHHNESGFSNGNNI